VNAEVAAAVPLNARVIGEPVAVEAIDREALSTPALCGANTTLTWQEAPAASVEAHVLLCVKLDAPLPVRVIAIPATSTCPVFLRVTVCAADVVPTS
jgi:hypothetical protein